MRERIARRTLKAFQRGAATTIRRRKGEVRLLVKQVVAACADLREEEHDKVAGWAQVEVGLTQ